MQQLLIGIAAAFVAAVIFGRIFIPILRRLKFGQEIRDEGPRWHEKKSGTPTMGGFIFIAGSLAGLVVLWLLSAVMGYNMPDSVSLGMMIAMMLA